MFRPITKLTRRSMLILPIMMLTLSILSAGSIQIHLVSEETVGYNLADIEELTFTNETLIIHLIAVDPELFDIAEIDHITFGEDLSVEDMVELVSLIPIRFLKNYPNPFNPETTITFELGQESRTLIEIYNVKGQRVRKLLDDTLRQGSHAIIWDGRNDRNDPVSSGVYFYRVSVNDSELFSRMIMLK